jgi:hypothetical protein
VSSAGKRRGAAGAHFLLYWQPRWVDYHLEKNQALARIGSYHFDRVSAGDTVWVVTVVRGQFYLAARMIAAEVLPRRAASERAGEELSGRFYAFARKGTAQRARRMDVTPLARELRFESERDRLDPDNPRLWPMQLQTMRKLARSSAHLLEQAWGSVRRQRRPPAGV